MMDHMIHSFPPNRIEPQMDRTVDLHSKCRHRANRSWSHASIWGPCHQTVLLPVALSHACSGAAPCDLLERLQHSQENKR